MPTTSHHAPIRSRLNNVLINVINHRETNLIISALLLFLCLFISLKSLLVRFELIRQQQQPFASDRNSIGNTSASYSTDQGPLLNRSDHPETRVSDHNDRPIASLFPDHDLQPIASSTSAPEQTETLPTDQDDVQSTSSSNNDQNEQEHRSSFPPEHDHRSAWPSDRDNFRLSSSLVSLFILLSLSLLLGRLLSYLFIPTITAPVLIGLLFANFVPFRSLFHYSPDDQLSALIYEIAFLLIIIRSAFGIDQTALRQFYVVTLCCGVGLVCPLIECWITVLASHLLFYVPLGASILLGFALCASSLAVISPIILRLRKEQRGTDSGLDSIVLTSISLDNFVALTGFAITFGVLSPRPDVLIYTLSRLPAELLIGSIFGILVGLLFRAFPRADASSVHFVRTALISWLAIAAHFGAQTVGCALFGPITALFATGVAKMRWHTDNNRNTRLEENALRLVWDLLVGQLLFLHLGMLVNISAFTWPMVGPALAVLALSLVARFIGALCCAFLCYNSNNSFASSQLSSSSSGEELEAQRHRCYKHWLFLAIATVPKASMQCQLLPFIVQLLAADRRHRRADASDAIASLLPVHVCLLAVLSVPFGHLLVRFVGIQMLLRPPRLTLMLRGMTTTTAARTTHLAKTPTKTKKKTNMPKLSTLIAEGAATAAGDTNNWAKVTESDPKDNRLKLEVGRSCDETLTNRQLRQQQHRL